MEINTPEQFMQAVNKALVCMDSKQRIAFVRWIKQRVNQYNFNYPQGYKEPTNVNEQPSNPSIVNSVSTEQPIIEATVVPDSVESSAK